MSTVDILVMPPFLAAVLIDASAPNASTCKNTIPLAVPTLEPTGLEVAATGIVMEQLDNSAVAARHAVTNVSFAFFIVLSFLYDPTRLAFQFRPRFIVDSGQLHKCEFILNLKETMTINGNLLLCYSRC
jgi:hypothetical protein